MKISILDISGCRRKLSVSDRDRAMGVMAELIANNPAAENVTKEACLKECRKERTWALQE